MSAGQPEPTPGTPLDQPTYARLAKPKAAALFALPVVLIAVAYGAGGFAHKKLTPRPADVAAVAHPDGAAVFAQHCASCHGVNGDGNGVAHLYPPARYFGMEKFKLASTVNGVPTDADLNRVIEHGIPGSAMPAFPYLTEADRNALVSHVRRLTWRGTYDRLYADAVKKYDDGGDEPEPHALAKRADQAVAPAAVFTASVSFPAPTPESLAKGKKLFLTSCAGCHGPEGRGDGPQVKDMKNENGTPNKPRDLTAGVYKYGGAPDRLFARIRLGIPGTPMPATPASTVPDADLADLVNYVRSLAQAAPAGSVAAK